MLVVEDDGDIASLLSEILETEGYVAVAVTDAAGLQGQLDPRPALVVLDLRLTRGGADQIIGFLKERGLGDVPVLLLSAASDLPDRAKDLGVTAYLAKPFEVEAFLLAVQELVATPR